MSQVSSLPLILLGAGGHAKVLHELMLASGHTCIGVCDPQLASAGAEQWRGLTVLGGDEALANFAPGSVGLVNGIGQLVGSKLRANFYLRLSQMGFVFPALAHPTAWIAPSASLEDGVQVMVGAVIQADCIIGQNTIINTKSAIDHDCVLGAHVHVAPGAMLCGNVRVECGAFVGAGAVLIPGVRVGEGAVVGAGVTVTRDVAAGLVLLGSPNRPKKN